MITAVYKHLFKAYAGGIGIWFGIGCEVARTLLTRVAIGIVLANLVTHLTQGDLGIARQEVWLLLGISLIGAVIGATGYLAAVWSENRIYGGLAQAFYQKLTGKDMAFFRNNQTGYLAISFRQYLDTVVQLLRLLRTEGVKTFISLVAPIVVLSLVDWRIGFVVFVIVGIQFLYVKWSSSRTNHYRHLASRTYRRVSGEVGDQITNIVAFKASGKAEPALAKVTELIKEEGRTYWLRSKIPVLLDLPRNTLTNIGITIALLAITETSTHNLISLSVLTITYLFQILYTLDSLPLLLMQHDNAVAKIHPTLHYLSDDYETIKDPDHPKPFVITKGAISIDDISFHYGDTEHTRTVLQHFTLTIQGGEHIGIVGLSGVGKSTLANLLMRFEDVTAGSIKIEGIDIRDVRQSELHQQISYVPQEPLLFHCSIRDNIAYFDRNASEEAITRAAQAAHAHVFITQLPHGYDTIVGERGIKLSGGQKQRVAIARAILKNAPLMIFDEATSALDSESEHIIQQALPDIIGNHTALVIAHRLSTVANLDRIILLHEGKIIEQGTHQELLERQGRYFALWQKQAITHT